jgi:hypothetical protein
MSQFLRDQASDSDEVVSRSLQRLPGRKGKNNRQAKTVGSEKDKTTKRYAEVNFILRLLCRLAYALMNSPSHGIFSERWKRREDWWEGEVSYILEKSFIKS